MKPKRCRIVPLPDHQVAFEIDGAIRLRWHFGPQYPRPFFYPAIGPSGHSLTRMGHPGAGDHDHHRSIWYAHAKVLGINFWSDLTPARIRQQRWLAYQDGDSDASMAVELGWFDGHDPKPLLDQLLIASVTPLPDDELSIELQSHFSSRADSLELQKTNFGFLAVRVAKSVSAHFGEGRLTNSQGRRGEPAIFGQPASWVDYSGPVGDGLKANETLPIDGITYFDHPSNANFPNRWHVREDGWMGCSSCFSSPLTAEKKTPLVVRHLLQLHRGHVDAEAANKAATQFANRSALRVEPAKVKHEKYRITR